MLPGGEEGPGLDEDNPDSRGPGFPPWLSTEAGLKSERSQFPPTDLCPPRCLKTESVAHYLDYSFEY